MTIAIYPGSFDPITNGHIDILKSGAEIFDKVIIAVSYNINKQGFLPIDERVALIKECVKDFPNVEVDSFQGLTVEYAKKRGAEVLLRGLRISLCIISKLSQSSFSSSFIASSSNSTAITFLACFTNCSVTNPTPGPISKTVSSFVIFAKSIMSPITSGLIKKF